MYSLLLRKALPFALTFILGSLVGGLFKAVGIGGGGASNARAYFYAHGGRHSCGFRARQRYLVAESKPLAILSVPDATWPDDFKPAAPWSGKFEKGYKFPGAWVRVTFGADGKVQRVEPSDERYPSLGAEGDRVVWECMARAARQIRFEPETVDGVPVTVTRDVEIQFND